MKEYPEETIVVPRFCEENGFYTTKERSELMGRIKGQNTKPEQKLRRALWALGFRYRKNVKKMPGKPDIVFRRVKLAVFIDGEFWHGANWEEKKVKIKTNRGFWIPKIERNMQRDRINTRMLEDNGWHVIRLWEGELKKDFENCVGRIVAYIEGFRFD
jgi:DNA mismatch endonuclease, patch repair protein